MKVLTKALIKKSEETAVNSGAFSFRELMFFAGNAAFDIINRRFDCTGKKIALLCGNGNNGGDGCVIARLLYEHGADVTVITPLGRPVTENALYYYKQLNSIKKSDCFEDEYDIVIDAIFGIGLSRPVDETLRDLFRKVNRSKAVKIAIDIPSGVEADSGRILGSAIEADLTVTFIALKPCFMLPEGSDFCGEVVVADIGVEPLGYSYLTNEAPILEKRRHNAHKGDFGTALMLCGSYGMAGAAILAARAALRSGLGIAKCVLCDGIYAPLTCAVPEAVCVPVKQTKLGTLTQKINIAALSQNCTALLFGCGMGRSPDIDKILQNIIETVNVPIVIDADGINALSRNINLLKKSKAPIILTPHPGEMARLCAVSVKEVEQNRVKTASCFAQKHNCTVILKGADTIIAQPSGDIIFNLGGNPGMATGGSGDVLAGILVSLLAQGMPCETAAKAAVFIHSQAGDKAAALRGERAMLPSDIIDQL